MALAFVVSEPRADWSAAEHKQQASSELSSSGLQNGTAAAAPRVSRSAADVEMACEALAVFAAESDPLAEAVSACCSMPTPSAAASDCCAGECFKVSIKRVRRPTEPERCTTENRSASVALANKSAPNEHWERRVSRDVRRAHSEAD